MNRTFLLALGLGMLGTLSSRAQTTCSLKISSAKELQQFFRYTGKDIPLISGHRGGTTKGYPENCIATFENTLRYTPAFFEIDPRLTRDSVIVLMHDATLDRTTNGKGKVSDYTWEELKKFRLKDPEGNVTDYRIPTLEEVITWSRGKTVLNLDKKDVPLEMTARLIRKMRAEAHVMLTVHNAKDAKFYYDGNKDLMFSAHIRSQKALDEYEKAGLPWSHVMAYIGPEYNAENKVLLDQLHARGVMCMISAAPSYDKLQEAEARREAYRATIKWGADVIESDLPIEAAAAIRPLMPAKSKKRKFFTQPATATVAQH